MGEVLALRLLPPLLLGALGCVVLPRMGWSAVQTLALVGPWLVCAVAPAAPQVSVQMGRGAFRLGSLSSLLTAPAPHVVLSLLCCCASRAAQVCEPSSECCRLGAPLRCLWI